MKYLSIGIDSVHPPMMYHNLESIELYQVNFEDMVEILVILRLITSSPNLKELQISVSPQSLLIARVEIFSFCEGTINNFIIKLLIFTNQAFNYICKIYYCMFHAIDFGRVHQTYQLL